MSSRLSINSISPFELVLRKQRTECGGFQGLRQSRLPVVRRARKIKTAFDRIGREQLSPNKPVTCLLYLRVSPA